MPTAQAPQPTTINDAAQTDPNQLHQRASTTNKQYNLQYNLTSINQQRTFGMTAPQQDLPAVRTPVRKPRSRTPSGATPQFARPQQATPPTTPRPAAPQLLPDPSQPQSSAPQPPAANTAPQPVTTVTVSDDEPDSVGDQIPQTPPEARLTPSKRSASKMNAPEGAIRASSQPLCSPCPNGTELCEDAHHP